MFILIAEVNVFHYRKKYLPTRDNYLLYINFLKSKCRLKLLPRIIESSHIDIKCVLYYIKVLTVMTTESHGRITNIPPRGFVSLCIYGMYI